MTLDLSFPRRPYVELYLNDDWQNVTNDVRQSPGIKIDRGRRNETTQSTPSRCTFTLDDGPDHGNGDYSPRNPLGQYYGKLGQNNPVRVGIEVGVDTFSRTVTGDWGTSEQNGTWSNILAGTVSSSVSGGVGVHSVTTTSSSMSNYLGGVDVRDVDVAVTGTISGVSNVTGGDLELANILLHGQSITNYYLVRLEITSAEVVQLRIMLDGTTTLAGPVVLSTAYTGQSWRVRAAMEQGHIMARAWPVLDAEPLEWQIGSVRETPIAGGFVGVRSGVASGNTNTKPVIFQYDDFEIRLPRFAGEVASLAPKSSIDHGTREVEVECGGLLRRIMKYTKQLQSPVLRWVTTDPTAVSLAKQYWPLEEYGTANVQGRDELGGRPVPFIRGTGAGGAVGAVKWGTTDNIPPSIVAAPELTAGGKFMFPVNENSTDSTSWAVSWGQRIAADAGARLWFRTTGSSGNSGYQIILYTDGTLEVYELTGGTLEMSSSLQSMNLGYDNVWHAMTFTCEDGGGGTTDITLQIDNVSIGANAAQALSELRLIELTSEVNTTPASSYSHVVIWSNPITETDYFQAFFGYSAPLIGNGYQGEILITRFKRLCDEQGIPYTYVGQEFAADLTYIGAQAPIAIGDLLNEIAERDVTVLYEPRTLPAIGLRTTDSVCNQDATATLDYSAFQVAPELNVVDDDVDPVNDVTAKGVFTGVEARVEQLTGPKNVNDPGTVDGAIGRYDRTVTVNTEYDANLQYVAGWHVHLGTVDESRFPQVTVNMRASSITNAVATTLLDLNIDDVLTLTGLDATLVFGDVRQVMRGYTETFDGTDVHVISYNVSPASPYDVMVLDSDYQLDSSTSTLNEALDTTETGVDVATTGGTVWTTDAGDVPFDVTIGGEQMTVTAISGASSPQTFTVTRSVNGVVKSHAVGAQVSLTRPYNLAL